MVGPAMPTIFKMSDMQRQLESSTTDLLVGLLHASMVPLSTRDLAIRIRSRHLRLSDHEVGFFLRHMLQQGQVEFRRGRWSAPSRSESFRSRTTVAPPTLSPESLSLLRPATSYLPGGVPQSRVEWNASQPEMLEAEDYIGRWRTFRRLVSYYRQCIRNEEGADASAFQNEFGKRFLYLRKVGVWYPRPGLPWRTSIPLGAHLSPCSMPCRLRLKIKRSSLATLFRHTTKKKMKSRMLPSSDRFLQRGACCDRRCIACQQSRPATGNQPGMVGFHLFSRA